MLRYGMRHHTISYWQRQAADLWRYNGIALRMRRDFASVPARTLAHLAIQIARIGAASDIRQRMLTFSDEA